MVQADDVSLRSWPARDEVGRKQTTLADVIKIPEG